MARAKKSSAVKLAGLYAALALTAKKDLKGAATARALQNIISESLNTVSRATLTSLTTNTANKAYAMAIVGDRKSRPINKNLFSPSLPLSILFDVIGGKPLPRNLKLLDKVAYTAAMSYPLAADLTKDGDKKSPGTFFEILVGHIFAARYDVNPTRTVQIPTLDTQTNIPTDYVFELPNKRRIHLPIKITSRERVVQVWAHQKLLDGMLGLGRFRGVLVCLSETNKQQNTSVVEVCLPGQ
jgi:hypothetical protein